MNLDANLYGLRTARESRAAGGAIFEARVIVSMAVRHVTYESRMIDDKLYALEIAYYRHADVLARAKTTKKKPPKKRARKTQR